MILHVDDDESFLELASRKFSNHNIEVNSCSKPEDVEERIVKEDIDLLLVDYEMPKVDGIELIEMVRDKIDLPIVLVTCKGSGELVRKAFSAGADDFIRKKEFCEDADIVAEKIRNLIEEMSARRELKRERDMYSTLVEEAINGVYIYQDGRIVFANESGCEFVDAERDEILGRPFTDFLADEYVDEILDRHKRRIAGEIVPNRKVVDALDINGDLSLLD